MLRVQNIDWIDGEASGDSKLKYLIWFLYSPPFFSSRLHFDWHLGALCLGNFKKKPVINLLCCCFYLHCSIITLQHAYSLEYLILSTLLLSWFILRDINVFNVKAKIAMFTQSKTERKRERVQTKKIKHTFLVCCTYRGYELR